MMNQIDPKKLILLHGFGAVLSAFLLGVILTNFEPYFGMPLNALYILAFLPCLFAVYDFICYFRITKNWAPYLKAIAIANLLYCFISIGFLSQHYESLTYLGWTYFLLELLILVVLIYVEMKTANDNGRRTVNGER